MTSTPSTATAPTEQLDEAQIARDAAEFSRRLAALDTHRDDQAQAAGRHRREQQTAFDEIGLPRGLAPLT